MPANLYKLVNGTHSTQNCIISNRYMARNLCISDLYAMVAHNTIMRQVAISHNQAVIADDGLFPVHCAPVNGNKLTDCCIISNYYPAVFALEF